ncbi:MAG TPA: type II toxin-antitoxin system Phd/YefM family antitoxin [Candidatus Angelobacter sp.]
MRFRNSRGIEEEAAAVSATEAKNEFGRLLEMTHHGRLVVITRHEAPKAVLMSIEEFNALSNTEHPLDTLSGEFDKMLEHMQTPKARAAMKAAFNATPEQLGKAAVAARKRG